MIEFHQELISTAKLHMRVPNIVHFTVSCCLMSSAAECTSSGSPHDLSSIIHLVFLEETQIGGLLTGLGE